MSPFATRQQGMAGRRVRYLMLILMVAAAGAAGCTSGYTSDAADEESPAELALTTAVLEGDSSFFEEPEPERPSLTPEEIAAFEMPPVPQLDEVSVHTDTARGESIISAASSPDVDILSAVDFDDSPTNTEVEAYGDGLPRTSNGRLISLDETAQVACANAEMAIWAIDDGDTETAAERVSRVVELLAESQSEGIESWAATLDAQADADPIALVGFLEACVAAGHDL